MMIQIKLFTPSPMLIKMPPWYSVWTQLPKKEENNSERNGMIFVKWFLNSSPKMISFILMNTRNMCQMNPISEDSGNTIENICSNSDLHTLLKRELSPNKKQMPSLNSSI